MEGEPDDRNHLRGKARNRNGPPMVGNWCVINYLYMHTSSIACSVR